MLDLKALLSKILWNLYRPIGTYHGTTNTTVANQSQTSTNSWVYPTSTTGWTYSHPILNSNYFSIDQNGFRVLKDGIYRLSIAVHFNGTGGQMTWAQRFWNYTQSLQLGTSIYAQTQNAYASISNVWVGEIQANQTIVPQVNRYAGSGKWRTSLLDWSIEYVSPIDYQTGGGGNKLLNFITKFFKKEVIVC